MMRVAIIVEAIPPFCGGAEHVAWVHAVELAKRHDVAVVTFGDNETYAVREGVQIYSLPRKKHDLASYCTIDRSHLNACLDRFSPSIIHCHMPNVLSACLAKRGRFLVSTIHDGVPEDELRKFKVHSRIRWLRFKLIRRINVRKSDAITCVSHHNLRVMRSVYASHSRKFSFIPNPISERFFRPIQDRDDNYVLNFGRQVPLKMAALLDVARIMPATKFVFVGTGEMVRDYGLPNVKFVGFSDAVESYIDAASICVFPSLSENFPLVGLEAMARGKTVIASRRGFSEYIRHMHDGFILDSAEPVVIRKAIERLMSDHRLRKALGCQARKTALQFHPSNIVLAYEKLYQSAFALPRDVTEVADG